MRFDFRILLAAAMWLGTAAMGAQAPAHFTAYSHCRFDDDLALVENTPLAKGVEGRTVKTVMGPKQVPLAGGVRLMYAYPGTEPLANVKVEQIPAEGYAQAKQDLIANFDQILTADDSSTRNYELKPRLNGLEIYGLDRKKLEGSTLGIYLFFADHTHTVTTIYFLNQDPAMRKFASLEEYAKLRNPFVQTLTACAAGHTAPPHSAKVVEHPAPKEAPPSVAVTPTEPPVSAALPNAPAPQGSAAPAPSAPASTPNTEPYIPPDAAPLVHPRNAADRKAAAAKAPAKTTKVAPAKEKKAVATKKPKASK